MKGGADCVVPDCDRYAGDRRICYACEKHLSQALRTALYRNEPGALRRALDIIDRHKRQGKLPL